MEWYIISALLILLIIVLFIKNTSVGVKILKDHVIKFLRDNEAYIVQSVYNSIPKEVRKTLPSAYIAEIVSYALIFIEKMLNEKNKIEK